MSKKRGNAVKDTGQYLLDESLLLQESLDCRLTILESDFLFFLRVTYEAMEEDSGTGDLVLGGTMPTG